MERLRFPLAEDHPRVAEQLRGVLEAEFDVVATVADGNALLQAADDYQPDVVVTDTGMPSLLGNYAGEKFSTKRLRALQDGRQRVGRRADRIPARRAIAALSSGSAHGPAS